MSDIEDTLKKLESKIAQLSEQLRDTKERRMFFNGLIMGLVLGIVGNMFVSYWMEYLKGFGIPLWGWGLGTATAYLGILYLIWRLDRESRRRPEKREN